jgi:hypothetical protein
MTGRWQKKTKDSGGEISKQLKFKVAFTRAILRFIFAIYEDLLTKNPTHANNDC